MTIICFYAKTELKYELKYELKGDIMSNNSNIETTSKNIIFYGPPGTGKTYSTVKRAVEIIDGEQCNCTEYKDYLNRYEELKKAGLIEFTTFHQSYGYEDFIEGIRPVMGDKNEASDLKYEIHDGVFKAFCKKENIIKVKEEAKVWAVRPAHQSIEEEYIVPCINNGYIQYDNTVENAAQVKIFQTTMEIGDIVLLYTADFIYNNDSNNDKINKHHILAVGVIAGKCEKAKETKDYPYSRKVIWLKDDIVTDDIEKGKIKEIKEKIIKQENKKNCYKTLNISGETINADYIIDTFKLGDKIKAGIEVKKIDKVLCNKVFIIDEINRGNISKIFGELITLIEDTKRIGASDRQSVKLPYSNEDFGVPDNVYIIGTMNTADRSIAALDTALRRRFDFEEMIPSSKLLEDINVDGINIKEMLDKINKRIEVLYDREHQIGHAYFMELKEKQTIEKLGSIFKYKIIPLLQEYFYEDYEKIRLVLGNNNEKPEDLQFIKKETLNNKELFGESDIVDDDDLVKYSINNNAFLNPNAYKKIYE